MPARSRREGRTRQNGPGSQRPSLPVARAQQKHDGHLREEMAAVKAVLRAGDAADQRMNTKRWEIVRPGTAKRTK